MCPQTDGFNGNNETRRDRQAGGEFIRPKKSLGQNFLNDMRVVQDILCAAELSEDDAVIEVGPGLGVMTGKLAEQAGFVAAVEIDGALIPTLKNLEERFGNVVILNRDILKTDVRRDILDEFVTPRGLERVKVVANLPYYITTPIVMKFLEENASDVDSLVIMVQKEVAERMIAPPGGKDYGAMTVTVNYFSEPEIMFTVPPHCFYPRPGVDSAVVRLKIRKEPPFELISREHFFLTVRAAFSQRRKTLTNALANAPYMNVTREKVAEILAGMGKDVMIRGERLSPEEFGQLSNLLIK
ncbi:MAG: 16S rRNA (adenine(1518)-N(6)/adenine(1519)-N(6))-dimethyltransferase RsmA [Clostridia bacterium]|nr:16S rRNA (adenine(1518)-N(6)/adenine(1519)-N(6))-dimethyltransferase RsmA [Clostridia bacterium]